MQGSTYFPKVRRMLLCFSPLTTLLASSHAASRAHRSCHSVSSWNRSSNFGGLVLRWWSSSGQIIRSDGFWSRVSAWHTTALVTWTSDWFPYVRALPWFSPQRSRVIGRCTHEFPHASCHSTCRWACRCVPKYQFTCCQRIKLIHFPTCTGILCRDSHCENGLVRCCLSKKDNDFPSMAVFQFHRGSSRFKHGSVIVHKNFDYFIVFEYIPSINDQRKDVGSPKSSSLWRTFHIESMFSFQPI